MISPHTAYYYFKTPLWGQVLPCMQSRWGEDNKEPPQETQPHSEAAQPPGHGHGGQGGWGGGGGVVSPRLVSKLKAKMKRYTNCKLCWEHTDTRVMSGELRKGDHFQEHL